MKKTIVDLIEFDKSFGDLPRQPSFWLDDLFFWTPIVLEASSQEHLPHGFKVYISPGWGGDIKYDEELNLLKIPIGVACGYYNQYVQEMEIQCSAAIATEIDPGGFYTLWQLYHNWDIEKEPWIENVVFKSLVSFKFREMIEFLVSTLSREGIFAGTFLDSILELTNSFQELSEGKKSAIRASIMEEPSTKDSKSTQQDKVQQIFNTFIEGDVQNLATGSSNVKQKVVMQTGISDEVFVNLMESLSKSNLEDTLLSKISIEVEKMRELQGTKGFKEHYQSFMSILADHIQVLGPIVAPYLPALTSLIP